MTIFSYLDDPATLLIYIGVRLMIIFTILPIHEYAHAYAANKMGDKTPLIAGRLTLNPLVHIDPIGAVLLFLFGFGWAKPVPINARNFKKYKKGLALTAFAGPLSNLICAAIGIFVYKILSNIFIASLSVPVLLVLLAIQQFISINLALAVFNLLPISPLDGSRILDCFLPYKAKAFIARNQRYITIGLWILIFTGLLQIPLSWLINLVYKLLGLLFFWVDPLMRLILG